MIHKKYHIRIRKMDASQYLRRLKESCTQTLSRPKAMDAGLRTQIVRNAATTTYISPAANASFSDCAKGFDGAVTPIHRPGCISHTACSDLENRYAEPIVLSGCPIPYMSSTYVQANSYMYQGIREQKSEAERLRNCKDSTRPPLEPTPGCLSFNKGILRTPLVNGYKLSSTDAFTIEWYQKLEPLSTYPIRETESEPYYYTMFSIGDINNHTEAMSFYYQVSPPNPISIYSVYCSRGMDERFYFGNFGTDGERDYLQYTDLTNQWMHIALVGDGVFPTNTLQLYVNGEPFGTTHNNYNFPSLNQSYLTIGGQSPLNPQYYYNGCMTNFRFTKGLALYTESFIPPTEPLEALPSTQLLLKTFNDFPVKDSSIPQKSITPIGSIQFIPDSPF